MNKIKKIFIQKVIKIHNYLSKLDKIELLKVKEEANKIKNETTKEILNEYIKQRRESNK